MMLATTASNTAGTPIHQELIAPSVSIHQMRRKALLRNRILTALVFILINFTLHNLAE